MATEKPSPTGAPADSEPYIPASTVLPEITPKAIVLGVILSLVLASANTYLGLFAGMTVSASIPAAVISMAVLRLFRERNILENNIVQTSASAGESLAAGAIFTFPALLFLGVWTEFHYWEVTIIAGLGGLLGVLFTIPLRRALIVEQNLRYPEGVATAEVLKAGETGQSGVVAIMWGGLAGAIMKIGSTGMKLWGEIAEKATYLGGTIGYFGTNVSPALVGVGYIVGLNIAVLVFIGGALNWFVAIPIMAQLGGIDATVPPLEAANAIWKSETRYLGVGAMIVGGVWALIQIRTSLWSGIRSGLHAYRQARDGSDVSVERTERELPMKWVLLAIGLSVIPLTVVFWIITDHGGVAIFMAVAMLVAGFLFSAVASYMAGLVGSSNNPISGVTIATILTTSLMLLGLFALTGDNKAIGAAAAILIGSVVCSAAAIGGDNLQDLKAGYLLGATPRNQQWMQIIGVVSAAFVMAPVMTLLHSTYGIGVTPEKTGSLSAPQATLMASVAKGVFAGGLPWDFIAMGMALAVVVITVDRILEKKGSAFRAPVLAVAIGIYLPFDLAVPILLGGLISHYAGRWRRRPVFAAGPGMGAVVAPHRDGLLFAAGLITGEAILGILLAIPILMKIELAVFVDGSPVWPGLLLLAVVCAALYFAATKRDREN